MGEEKWKELIEVLSAIDEKLDRIVIALEENGTLFTVTPTFAWEE
jgi:hypothetical protein